MNVSCLYNLLISKAEYHKRNICILLTATLMPSTMSVLGQEGQWLKSLSTLAPCSTHQLKAHLISHVAMPSTVRAAMQNLDKQIWKSRIIIPTKLKLYNTCILPIFLYGSECWAVTKRDVLKIDALDQWCFNKSC